VAGTRIRKVYKRIVRMGETIDADTPPQAYHDLRKKGKELRYLLELFGVKLFDEEAVTPLVRSLKGLQDVLGRHQDREVQIAMLDEADRADLLTALRAARDGDFSSRLELRSDGVMTEVAEALNGLLERNDQMSRELLRVGKIIGREGRMTERAELDGAGGAWA